MTVATRGSMTLAIDRIASCSTSIPSGNSLPGAESSIIIVTQRVGLDQACSNPTVAAVRC